MSKKKCKREKCKWYNPDSNDGLGLGCDRADEMYICERQLNEDYTVYDGYQPVEEKK